MKKRRSRNRAPFFFLCHRAEAISEDGHLTTIITSPGSQSAFSFFDLVTALDHLTLQENSLLS
jgi:hypothetical protein